MAAAIALEHGVSSLAAERVAVARDGFGGGRGRPAIALHAAAERRRTVDESSLVPTSPEIVVLPVTSCEDDGSAGTLRSVVAGAVSGDIIDLSALTCSTISLASGAIVVSVESLRFVGPGSDVLSLDANQSYRRIIEHSGHGSLGIAGLRLTGGWAGIGSAAYGGCVYSAGSVFLDDSAVVFCKAVSGVGQMAEGGGIFAAGSLTLHHSVVSGNEANPGTYSFGGGAFAGAGLYADYSTISGNYALRGYYAGNYLPGYGGGAFVVGNVNIVASTISDNYAVNVGAVSIAGFATAGVIVNSTVSGNRATQFIAGIYSNTPLLLYNSTIAFNSAAQQSATYVTAGGVQVYATSANLQSSIIANNTAGGIAFDLGTSGGVSIVGANNLVRTSSNLLPPDTLFEDPQLLPLQENGGETATHALAPTSPAIDHGNTTNPSPNDQRGLGYTRTYGAAADIGAYELQVVDFIFRDGFDGGM